MEAVRIPSNRQHSFGGGNGLVLHFRRVLIPCGPYPAPNMFVIKPALIPRDEIPPFIVRMCPELRQRLERQIETTLSQLTCQCVGNPPERFQGIANPRQMSANHLRRD
jgi:hypothetical protein